LCSETTIFKNTYPDLLDPGSFAEASGMEAKGTTAATSAVNRVVRAETVDGKAANEIDDLVEETRVEFPTFSRAVPSPVSSGERSRS
jgi:hypothetical protein